MTSYAYARTHAYAHLPTDIYADRSLYKIVYNEPNDISPSYFIKFKRFSTLEIHMLLVALRHIIRRYLIRISKLCMGGSLYGIFVFLPEFTSHMLYIPITFCTN